MPSGWVQSPIKTMPMTTRTCHCRLHCHHRQTWTSLLLTKQPIADDKSVSLTPYEKYRKSVRITYAGSWMVCELHHSPSHFLQDFPQHFLQDFLQNFPQDFLQIFRQDFPQYFLQYFPQDFLQNFPKDFPQHFLQDFLQNFPQDFLQHFHKISCRISRKISCKISCRISYKISRKISQAGYWLVSSPSPIPSAKFPPITVLLNRPTNHKSANVSPSPFPQISWESQINE